MDTCGRMLNITAPMEGQERDQTSWGTLTKYDVFLNHRGPDLKKTFVSHLNKALRQAGREPFLDAKALVQGRHAFNSINQVLSEVRVHVAIFSPGYAESKYCLNELCDMLASKKPIIPVFYDVEPENLRWTEVGPFAEAFREHLRKGRDKDVTKWKAALLQAAAITGFKRVDCDDDTVKLEEKIVAAVLMASPLPPPLSSARQLVGLMESLEHVINMLHKMGDNVGVIGICGVGGIGKTTLAREVYNHEHSKFGSGCFLSDVKEAKGVAVKELQMKMVADLLHIDAKKMHWNSDHWFDKIRNYNQKVILVIDDIDKRKQLNELIPDLRELPPGSRVLITSREIGILKNILLDIPQGILYQVPELSLSDSLDLFVWCAFRKTNIDLVDASFHDFVKEIVNACCGLPLALEVMGGFLSDKKNLPNDEKYWQQATLALRKNGDIITSLQMSYDGLVENEDKSMFLDIACFMLGHPKRVALEVWDSSGLYGASSWSLSRLMDKCLVKVDYRGQLSMHDLLRDMGRNVVTQRDPSKPEMRSHIWEPKVATKILQKKKGSDEVLALSVIGEKSGTACKAELYARMRELRYLLLDDCPVSGDFSGWSEELRWLQWRYFPRGELPPSLKLPNLAVLDLANSNFLSRIWNSEMELEILCEELRVLILSDCIELRELPEHINKMAKLKFVNLGGCKSLNSLPDSLGDLAELEYLSISGCKLLDSLPDSIVKLLELRELHVNNCSGLKKLPKEFGRLKSLAIFEASGSALEELSESFGLLQCLEKVTFNFCMHLCNLSENFGCLVSLQKLSLNWCERLSVLPDSFTALSNLQELHLYGCKLLKRLPPPVCGLKKLRNICMRLTPLEELPEDFGQLQSLIEVNFNSCKQLQNLGEHFGCLVNLEKLDLRFCKSLTKLPNSFSNLSNLVQLDLSYCKLDQKMPASICGLKKLRVLNMMDTPLKEFPKYFGQPQSLTEVDLSDHEQLQLISEEFGRLQNLRELYLCGCESLTKLPNWISKLTNLEKLDLSHFKLNRHLFPSINQLKRLRVLTIRHMELVELPEDLGPFHSLIKSSFKSCKQLRRLGDNFSCMGSLQKFNLAYCRSLTNLPDSFSKLTNLQRLNVHGCELLEQLPPSIHKLKNLRVVKMGWTAIKALPHDFGQLCSLTRVDLNQCKQLQILGKGLFSLRSLRNLNLSVSETLRNLPASFCELSNLETLDLEGCKLLEQLPPSMHKLKKLKVVWMGKTR